MTISTGSNSDLPNLEPDSKLSLRYLYSAELSEVLSSIERGALDLTQKEIQEELRALLLFISSDDLVDEQSPRQHLQKTVEAFLKGLSNLPFGLIPDSIFTTRSTYKGFGQAAWVDGMHELDPKKGYREHVIVGGTWLSPSGVSLFDYTLIHSPLEMRNVPLEYIGLDDQSSGFRKFELSEEGESRLVKLINSRGLLDVFDKCRQELTDRTLIFNSERVVEALSKRIAKILKLREADSLEILSEFLVALEVEYGELVPLKVLDSITIQDGDVEVTEYFGALISVDDYTNPSLEFIFYQGRPDLKTYRLKGRNL